MKYNTYEELLKAYKSGEIKEPMQMDNDECFVMLDPEDESSIVFQGNGYQDIVELANLAGIPTEWV